MKTPLLLLALSLAGFVFTSEASAKVLHSRQGAFKLAFPAADQVKRKHVYLTADQLAAIQRACQCEQKSKLLTVYQGFQQAKPLGFAYIDTHVVRTLPETFMVVIDNTGKLRGVHILAFHEPPEYMPRGPWLTRFVGQLNSARPVAGVAGATLSANAVTRATRRIIAIHRALGLTKTVNTVKTAAAR